MDIKATKTILLLWRAFREYRYRIVFFVILGFLASILAGVGVTVVIPLFALLVGNQGGEAGDITRYFLQIFNILPFALTPRILILGIVSLFVSRAAILYLFSYVRSQARFDYQNKAMSETFSGLLEARWPYLLKQKLGHVQMALGRDIQQSSTLLENSAEILFSSASIITFLAFAMTISPQITLYTAAAGALLLGGLRPLVVATKRNARLSTFQERQVAHFVAESTLGLKTVKTLGAETALFKKGGEFFKVLRDLNLKRALTVSLSRISGEPVSVVFISAIFLLSYRSGGFDFAVFAAAIYLIQRIFVNLQAAHDVFQAMNERLPHLENFLKFKETLEEEREENKKEGLSFGFSREIIFKDVSFAYEERTPVLQGMGMVLKKGEMLALIGPSGAGKTSVADLLLRLFKPGNGAIFCDGTEAERFDLGGWRRSLGYVSQDLFLFNDSIQNNIRFYNPEVSDSEIIEAAKQANSFEFISKLPEGFQTVIGERGVMLSAGQRQRVVLARVLARRPQILILDEATSALDAESEALVQKSIQALRGSITVFVIAHRLSTVVDADRVLVLDQGKIIEEGDPQKLLADNNSYFHRMYYLKEEQKK